MRMVRYGTASCGMLRRFLSHTARCCSAPQLNAPQCTAPHRTASGVDEPLVAVRRRTLVERRVLPDKLQTR